MAEQDLADILAAAIRDGLQQGEQDKDAKELAASQEQQAHKDSLAAAFRVAHDSGLIAGLQALDDATGGRLKVSKPGPLGDKVVMTTKLPVATGSCHKAQYLKFEIKSDGTITARGDRAYHGNDETVTTHGGNAAPILQFAAKKAGAKGWATP
jgi:hypothetical protein